MRGRKINLDSIAYDDHRMELWMEQIGKRIKKERMEQGLSISKLAELANLSASCISKAESRKCRISLRALAKISAALDIPPGNLLEHTAQQGEPDDSQKSESERFENMTKEAEEEIVDFILELAAELIQVMEKKS